MSALRRSFFLSRHALQRPAAQLAAKRALGLVTEQLARTAALLCQTQWQNSQRGIAGNICISTRGERSANIERGGCYVTNPLQLTVPPDAASIARIIFLFLSGVHSDVFWPRDLRPRPSSSSSSSSTAEHSQSASATVCQYNQPTSVNRPLFTAYKPTIYQYISTDQCQIHPNQTRGICASDEPRAESAQRLQRNGCAPKSGAAAVGRAVDLWGGVRLPDRELSGAWGRTVDLESPRSGAYLCRWSAGAIGARRWCSRSAGEC